MDFRLSEEQELVQNTARSLLNNECNLDFVRASWQDRKLGKKLWTDHLSEWTDIARGDATDMTLFMVEYGKVAAPGVFFATTLAAQVAEAAGVELKSSATVAVSGADGLWLPNNEVQKHFVPSADEAEEIVVVSGSPDAPKLIVVPAHTLPAVEVDQMDQLRPQFRVDTSNAPVGTAIGPAAWKHAHERALLTTAAELVGVGRWLLDTSVEYAKERVQFNRPIGSFQGLQWKLVDAALELECAAAYVSYAAMCVDADDSDRTRAVHGAKASAGKAARRCARTGMQVHGGVGYTWEYGLHNWLRRAYAGDAFLGPSAVQCDEIAKSLFDA